jgi:hypothetical protein
MLEKIDLIKKHFRGLLNDDRRGVCKQRGHDGDQHEKKNPNSTIASAVAREVNRSGKRWMCVAARDIVMWLARGNGRIARPGPTGREQLACSG